MDDQISVTFIGINYAPEPLGIAPYATGLCRGLANRGYRVNVVTGIPHYPEWTIPPDYRWKWASNETIDGLPVKRVRHSVPQKVSNSRRLLMEATFGIRGALSNWSRPDVVICTTPALFSTAALCLRNRATLPPRPAIGVWVQDLYSVGLSETQKVGPAAKIAARLESWVMREAESIVVAHNRFRAQLVQNLHVDPTKIRTIKNWTHVQSNAADDRRADRGRFGWSENETVVLHAGSMGVKQGLENVVHAAQIADKKQLNLRFVLLGDGNQRRSLEEMALQTPCLEFRDPLPQSDFVAALKAADILLVNEKPGVAEMSIPSKLTSYFQSGTPVLASTSPLSNAAQEIRNSKAGIVVDNGDPVLLVDAAAALGSDTKLRTQLGANGIEYAATELSEEASLDKFDQWIRQMAASRRT
ncbi:MAG TPA: glycosyltransferase family 4 protein [Mycobacterium sp.]|nr:glycosyltransferase family 4 protein [Mycobacterium sp.]